MSRHRRAAAVRTTSPLDPRVERAKNVGALIATAWPMAAFLILAAYAEPDSFDATASQLGMNWPGDLLRALGGSAIETALLALILRPWSFRDSIGRLVLALVLFAPWTAFVMLKVGRGGSVIGAHWFWLLMVCFGLVYGIVKVAVARRN
jgi:hypothetical protein